MIPLWGMNFLKIVFHLVFVKEFTSVASAGAARNLYEKVLDHEYSFATPLQILDVKNRILCHKACSKRRNCEVMAFGETTYQVNKGAIHNCVLFSDLHALLSTRYLENWVMYKKVIPALLVAEGDMSRASPTPLRDFLLHWCHHHFASSNLWNPLFDGDTNDQHIYSWRCYGNTGYYMVKGSIQYSSRHKDLVQVINANKMFTGSLADVSQSCTSKCEEKGMTCLLYADTANSVWFFWNAGKKCLHNLDEQDIWSNPGEPYYNPHSNKCYGWINPRATYTSCGIIIKGVQRLCFCG